MVCGEWHEIAAKPMGGTAYLQATYEAVDMLGDVPGRRAVVLMTDGVDLNSDVTLREVIKKAQAKDVPVYTLGVGEPGRGEPVTTVLVLDHSGSMADPASDKDSVSKIEALHRAPVTSTYSRASSKRWRAIVPRMMLRSRV